MVGDQLVAAIETEPESWSNRLRVNELWIADEYHHRGIGRALMNIAKEEARQERRRAIILETQSCNVNAIGFYLHQGFTLIGLDTCSYTNRDCERKEVRIELGFFPERKAKLKRDELIIRKETEADYPKTERMTQLAFWNKHHQGCDEHYLVHKMRKEAVYLPELSRIAVKDNEIIGAIFYAKAYVQDGDTIHEVVTFGPLCVAPDWQGAGVGELLLRETMPLVGEAGYPAIIMYGEPDYYPRIGFQTCDHFGITTPDGQNWDSFMGIETIPGRIKDIKGKFYEPAVYDDLPEEEVDELTMKFPKLEKQYYPSQWH